ncbi:MAG: hydrogenase maturation nickel metallochaperone HypA [Treponema sp.]|nr:hydrogenase maturation nickel metallochaperone HypA [Treponema sp.]
MHEYPITQNIIEVAARYANSGQYTGPGKTTVKKIALVIGEGSGVTGESIKLYFDIIAQGTICEDAVLEIENVKPMLKCKVCGRLFVRKPFSFECECGGEGEPTAIGREFYVKYIEVERQ